MVWAPHEPLPGVLLATPAGKLAETAGSGFH